MDYSSAAEVINFAAVPLWLLLWWFIGGFTRSKSNRLMWLPFALSVAYLLANGLLGWNFSEIGDVAYEESRFGFIDSRAKMGLEAATGSLVVATIVYGLTIKKLPIDYLRFIITAYVCIVGVASPILWIPIEIPEMFFVLRHFQTIALNFGLFLVVGGVIILLDDLIKHGEVKVKKL